MRRRATGVARPQRKSRLRPFSPFLSNSRFFVGAIERAFIVPSCVELQDRHNRGAHPITGNGRAIQAPFIVEESQSIAQLGSA
jgi:hypothetical protein